MLGSNIENSAPQQTSSEPPVQQQAENIQQSTRVITKPKHIDEFITNSPPSLDHLVTYSTSGVISYVDNGEQNAGQKMVVSGGKGRDGCEDGRATTMNQGFKRKLGE
ncbi:hypothetical protein L1887_09245 [Cichorium endivia]|nr:hypothetical protein L1887_09245 [Cichorium endivia]